MNQTPKEIELKGKSNKYSFQAIKPPIRALLPKESFMYITTYFTEPGIYNMDAIKIYTNETELAADIEKNWQHVFFYKEITSEDGAESIKNDLILGNAEHDIARAKFK